MNQYELSEQVVNNIITFLDRVDVKGLKEVQAMSEILTALATPLKKEN